MPPQTRKQKKAERHWPHLADVPAEIEKTTVEPRPAHAERADPLLVAVGGDIETARALRVWPEAIPAFLVANCFVTSHVLIVFSLVLCTASNVDHNTLWVNALTLSLFYVTVSFWALATQIAIRRQSDSEPSRVLAMIHLANLLTSNLVRNLACGVVLFGVFVRGMWIGNPKDVAVTRAALLDAFTPAPSAAPSAN